MKLKIFIQINPLKSAKLKSKTLIASYTKKRGSNAKFYSNISVSTGSKNL